MLIPSTQCSSRLIIGCSYVHYCSSIQILLIFWLCAKDSQLSSDTMYVCYYVCVCVGTAAGTTVTCKGPMIFQHYSISLCSFFFFLETLLLHVVGL